MTLKTNLTFSEALVLLKKGKRICREGWNGKGMWLVRLFAGANVWTNITHGTFPMQDCIGMKTADNKMQPGWLASQADLLANDWMEL